MAFAFPSPTNVFIQGYGNEVQSRLAVEYVRNWKKFPFMDLCTRVQINQPIYLYKRIDPTAQGRVINNPQAYLFPDGQDLPMNAEESKSPLDYVQVVAERRGYAYKIGNLLQKFSPDDEISRAVNDIGNKAMTEMAIKFWATASLAGNYLTGHTDTASNLGGGTWANATLTNKFIQKTLHAVRRQIDKATYGTVGVDDLVLVVGPELADVMGRCQEIADGFPRQEGWDRYLQFEVFKQQRALYGLPPVLYGFTLMVDNTLKTITKPLASSVTTSFLPTPDSAYVMTKAGFMKGENGSQAFSSYGLFEVNGEELRVEVLDEPIHERKIIKATTMYTIEPVGKEGSFLVTSC
jgi:hypothetical protein